MRYTIKLGTYQEGTIPLGFQKENKVKEIKFDTSIWESEYGQGVLTLAIQRNGDAQPYPKVLVDNTWTIEALDVEKKGIGECQLEYRVDDKVKESAVYKFFVERSLDSTGEMPDPYISYFEQIIEVGAQAEADADRAEAAADSIKNLTAEAETLPAGSSASASYDSETGIMTFGIPQGEQGERGADGVTPDIDIGTVETLETGVPAYANITGTVENPSLNLGLPKGNTGDTGATGAPAGFGAVTATIDGQTGTPSVDVTASGADTAKNFAFAFHNLKGEQGEQGEQGDPGVVQDVQVNGTSVVDQNGVAVIKMPELVKTVNGNPIVIDDAFGEVKNLTVELLPIQEGSGTPSPQNVRPITGHDSVTVGVTGKNLLNVDDLSAIHSTASNIRNGVEYTMQGTYTIKANATGGSNDWLACRIKDAQGTYGTSNVVVNAGAIQTARTLTVGAGDTLILFDAQQNTLSASKAVFTNTKVQVELNNTATDYAPYHGQSKTVTLPHTVYGAGVGVTSGESKETWANIPSYNGETITEPWLSSMDEYVQGATPTTGAQVTYKLATPTDLSTTPTSLTLYNGDNVISSDGGMELTYVQDMATVIRKIEAQI